MSVNIRRDLHLRDLKLLLAGGEVHVVQRVDIPTDFPGSFRTEEVVCTIRLCPDAMKEIEKIVREGVRVNGTKSGSRGPGI